MNAISEVTVTPATLEHVLGTGDLSKLSTSQRVEYYANTCRSLGLNPLTRPFRFLALNGQIQLYATRDATDQLRKSNGITLRIVDQRVDGDLFVVTVAAKDKAGREDQDIGAVTLARLSGDSRANALMKALTKAKRRVTLSICGLGLTDESELDTIPGAAVFDADQPPPVTAPAVAAPAAPGPFSAAAVNWIDKYTTALTNERSLSNWIITFEDACATASSQPDLVRLMGIDVVKRALAKGSAEIKQRITQASSAAFTRLTPTQAAMPLSDEPWKDEDLAKIDGEERLHA